MNKEQLPILLKTQLDNLFQDYSFMYIKSAQTDKRTGKVNFHPIGIISIGYKDGVIYLNRSLTSIGDRFNKREGIELAFNRLIKSINNIVINLIDLESSLIAEPIKSVSSLLQHLNILSHNDRIAKGYIVDKLSKNVSYFKDKMHRQAIINSLKSNDNNDSKNEDIELLISKYNLSKDEIDKIESIINSKKKVIKLMDDRGKSKDPIYVKEILYENSKYMLVSILDDKEPLLINKEDGFVVESSYLYYSISE